MTTPLRRITSTSALVLTSLAAAAPAAAGTIADYLSPADDAQFTAGNAIVTKKLPAGATGPGTQVNR